MNQKFHRYPGGLRRLVYRLPRGHLKFLCAPIPGAGLPELLQNAAKR